MNVNAGALVALLVTGCSSGPVTHYEPQAPVQPAATAATADAAAMPATAAPAPARVRMDGHANPASWYEPHLGTGVDDPLEDPKLVAVGSAVAVLKTRAGYFAVGPQGADGPLPVPPHTTWVGVGGTGDSLLAATDAGDLYRATYPTRAAAGAFTKLASVSGATAWDAVPGWVVAAAGTHVHVSRRGSKRFKRRRVVRAGTVDKVLVRNDGVIVAVALEPVAGATPTRVTYQAGARGRFTKAPFQPEDLLREGARIRDDVGDCSAVLAADGRQWVLAGDRADEPGLYEWDELLEHDHAFALSPPRDRMTATRPAAPKAKRGEALKGIDRGCMMGRRGPGGPGYHGRGTMRGYLGGVLGRITGSRGPAVYPSRTDASLLRDVTCAARDVVQGECKPTALMHGTARAAVFDRKVGSARLVVAPQACTPVRVTAIHGAVLLRCKEPSKPEHLSIHALAGATFVREVGDVPDPEDHDAVASDGTLGLYTTCGKDPCVWLRSPVAPGTPSAWRAVAIPRARAYRVLPGARVLALVSQPPLPARMGGPETVSFVVDEPGGKRSTVIADVLIETTIHGFSVDSDGRILLTVEDGDGDGNKGKRTRRTYVARDGTLVDLPANPTEPQGAIR